MMRGSFGVMVILAASSAGAQSAPTAGFVPGSQGRADQGTFASVNGTRLYYQDEGSGPALVLIHGWPMSARMWDDQARAFKDRYRVIRYDRRGFGRSPAEPWNEG